MMAQFAGLTAAIAVAILAMMVVLLTRVGGLTTTTNTVAAAAVSTNPLQAASSDSHRTLHVPETIHQSIAVERIRESDIVDVVIPVGPRDVDIVHDTIPYLQRNCIGLRRIFIVSRHDVQIQDVTLIPESKFPFDLAAMSAMGIRADRRGWYLQQLLKLYAAETIGDLHDNFMVWDADSYLLRPVPFLRDGKALFNPSESIHTPYFTHMKKLHSALTMQTNLSGICNFMVFNRHALRRLFGLVEHGKSVPFWKLFLKDVDQTEISGASEFEVYFNYMLKFEPEKIELRPLRYNDHCRSIDDVDQTQTDTMPDYVSCHWYKRDKFKPRAD